MTAPPPDGYNREELLAMELPDLGRLRQITQKVADDFSATAETLTPTGHPMDTCRALRAAAESMVMFSDEYGRYFAAAYGVQAEPTKAWLAQYEQDRVKEGRDE